MGGKGGTPGRFMHDLGGRAGPRAWAFRRVNFWGC
jgi:hypothetical protein